MMKPCLETFAALLLLWLSLDSLSAKPRIHFGRCNSTFASLSFCRPLDECHTIGENERSSKEFREENACEARSTQDTICCPQEDTLDKLIETVFAPTKSPPRVTVELPVPPHCGHMLRDRIYGGHITGPEEYPWMALIKTTSALGTSSFVCGGVLICDQWVLTAAHCHNNRDGRITSVRLGEWRTDMDIDCVFGRNNENDCLPAPIDVSVDRVFQHPSYYRFTNANDIALLRLANRVNITAYIKPICLPVSPVMRENAYENMNAEISGWGRTENNEQTSTWKLKASLKVWPREDCNRSLTAFGTSLDDRMLCASGGTNVSSCRGDSGGPLMLELSTFYAIGVISMGVHGCRRSGMPVVFTRVATYMDWIMETINTDPGEVTETK